MKLKGSMILQKLRKPSKARQIDKVFDEFCCVITFMKIESLKKTN